MGVLALEGVRRLRGGVLLAWRACHRHLECLQGVPLVQWKSGQAVLQQ